MNKKSTSPLLGLFMFAAFSAYAVEAPDTRSPLDKYKGDAEFRLMLCPMSFQMAQLKAETGEAQDEKSDYATCISQGKTEAKANLTKALATVKGAKAQEALKSYHVTFVTALEGIKPGLNERVMDYKPRQQALAEKMTSAWARFEIEQ